MQVGIAKAELAFSSLAMHLKGPGPFGPAVAASSKSKVSPLAMMTQRFPTNCVHFKVVTLFRANLGEGDH
jgi:hypothetical protein